MSRGGRWVLPVAFMTLIVSLSATTGHQLPPVTLFRHSDKVLHLGLYGCLLLSFVPGRYRTPLASWLPGAVAISATFAVSDEIHQAYVPGRQPDVLDLLADWLGIALAAVAVSWLQSRQNRILS